MENAMGTTSPTRRAVIVSLGALAAAAVGLTACGKKGELSPPEGEEKLYTYPQAYPKPSTQVPGSDKDSRRQNTTPDDISIFPDSRNKTKTY